MRDGPNARSRAGGVGPMTEPFHGEASEAPLRVAVWGLGPHALKSILPALRESHDLRLHGVCSRDAALVGSIAQEYCCLGWTRAEAMLGNVDVDVVYVATPIGLHAEQGAAVLRADKHLWCEKPLAEREEEVASLVSLSREHEMTIAEGFMYLYHPQFAALLGIWQSGRLGRLNVVTCRLGIPPLQRPGFRTNAALGGGAFLDVGSYPLSLATALFPEDRPEILLAEIAAAPGAPVDTVGRAVLRYSPNVSVSLEWGSGVAYRNEVDLWGSIGCVSTERIFSKPADYVPRFRLLDTQGQESVEAGHSGNAFVAMFEAFGGLASDPTRAESERITIMRRAELRERVRR
jgi:predicted dehydrogenase